MMPSLMMLAAIALQATPAPFDLPVGSDYVLATLVVGFCMSPIASALNRRNWPAEAKAAGAFLWCVVASLILLVAGNRLGTVPLDFRAWFSTFLVVFVMAIGLYKGFFQPSGIGPAIEEATG